MLLAPHRGFVFLAMPKTASTSIEEAFSSYAAMTLEGIPRFKHTQYAGFRKFLQPFLASKGFPRESYEVVCAFREPFDWLSSWWRYRSREQLADPSYSKHSNYTGHVSFEQFVLAYMNGDEQYARVQRPSGVKRQSGFVRANSGEVGVDRIFRYERLELLVEFLSEKVGKEIELGTSNVSPEREPSLSSEVKGELLTFLEPEYRIYEQAIG